MNRKLLCHSLVSLLLLSFPSQPWAAFNPFFSTDKQTTGSQPSPPAVPKLTDEAISESVPKLKARVAQLQLQLLPEAVAAMRGSLMDAAEPQELQEWESLAGRLARLLDSHANTLIRIRNVRKSNRDRAVEAKSWQGFTEKPPYPVSLLDSLGNAMRAKQIDLQAMDIIRSSAESEADDFAKGLKVSRKEVRLAEENVEKNAGKAGEPRSKWLLTLARLRDEVNQVGSLYCEARLTLVNETSAGLQAEIDFLGKKLAVARGNYRFSDAELEAKLRDIETSREQLRKELDQTIREEEKARKQLDAGEAAIRKAQADLASRGAARVPLDRLLKEQERWQTLFDAAGFRVQLFRGMSRLLRSESEVWKDRHRLAQGRTTEEEADKLRISQSDMNLVARWKEYIAAQYSRIQVLTKSQEEKLASASLPEADRDGVRAVLAAYRGEEALLRRGNAILNEYEQLVLRRNEEAKRVQGERTPLGRVRAVWDTVSSLVAKVWHAELYVAEETIIADNQKIVRPRSVTLGKLMEAFLILLVGAWVVQRLKKLFHWVATNRLKLGVSDAQLYGRLLGYLLFFGVLVGALVFVNIPLAVFAFFGGALAIGVGFGAQTLINNFISGLILMFDRTIRVGDMVEVDGHRGRVASIGMRSSSIKRFDGVELLVPNSHFLQQNVINWTSSDKRVRYSIPVGVAYGSPTHETQRLILAAVEEQPEVLRDPQPCVVFENFADSSLNFTAYFWIEMDPEVNSLVVFSDIRHRIGERLAKAGIVIPFPQRDLHVAADKPLEIRVIPPE